MGLQGAKRGKYLTFKTEGGMTLEEVAAVLGISRARAHQLEVQTLRKIRDRFPWLAELINEEGRRDPLLYHK